MPDGGPHVEMRSSVDGVTAPTASTLAELRASGHVHKPLRTEIRDNLLAALAEGRDPQPRP